MDGELVLEVDAEFSDLLSKVDFAGSFQLEGLRGSWGFMTDLFYIDLSDSGEIPFPGPIGQSVSARMDMQLVVIEAGAVYSYRQMEIEIEEREEADLNDRLADWGPSADYRSKRAPAP